MKRAAAATLTVLLALGLPARAAEPPVPAALPAEWRSFDLVVSLENLPHTHVSAADFKCAAAQPSFALNVEAPIAAGRQAAAPVPPPR